MKILANEKKEYGVEFVEMDELLEKSDVVSLHLHHTEETRGLIGEKELKLMQPSSILINVSRAQLVDYDALYRQLSQNQLGGCGLDVYYNEPTTGKEQLLNHAKVVATPHMAGSTRDIYQQAIGNAIINFRRVVRGKEPFWIVNGVKSNNIKFYIIIFRIIF